MADGLRYQLWIVTINSQQRGENQELQYALKEVFNHFTRKMNKFSLKSPDPGFSKRDVNITRVLAESRVELGPQRELVHIHGRIEIVSSNGMVSLDYSKIKKWLDWQLEDYTGGVHFQASLVKNYNAQQKIKEYINKSPAKTPQKGNFKIKT